MTIPFMKILEMKKQQNKRYTGVKPTVGQPVEDVVKYCVGDVQATKSLRESLFDFDLMKHIDIGYRLVVGPKDLGRKFNQRATYKIVPVVARNIEQLKKDYSDQGINVKTHQQIFAILKPVKYNGLKPITYGLVWEADVALYLLKLPEDLQDKEYPYYSRNAKKQVLFLPKYSEYLQRRDAGGKFTGMFTEREIRTLRAYHPSTRTLRIIPTNKTVYEVRKELLPLEKQFQDAIAKTNIYDALSELYEVKS